MAVCQILALDLAALTQAGANPERLDVWSVRACVFMVDTPKTQMSRNLEVISCTSTTMPQVWPVLILGRTIGPTRKFPKGSGTLGNFLKMGIIQFGNHPVSNLVSKLARAPQLRCSLKLQQTGTKWIRTGDVHDVHDSSGPSQNKPGTTNQSTAATRIPFNFKYLKLCLPNKNRMVK